MNKQNEPLLFIDSVKTEINLSSEQTVYDSRFPKKNKEVVKTEDNFEEKVNSKIKQHK